jgi:hypothetical protein
MPSKIVIITTDGGNREDGNVYYSRFLLVTSDTLQFDEPIFTDETFGPRGYSTDSSDDRMTEVTQILIDLGYKVETPETDFIEIYVG